MHYIETGLAACLVGVLGFGIYALPREARATDFERNTSTQVLHLDVGDLEEAKQVRLAVLGAWSRSSADDVIIEPMADAQGRKFYCIKLAQQEN